MNNDSIDRIRERMEWNRIFEAGGKTVRLSYYFATISNFLAWEKEKKQMVLERLKKLRKLGIFEIPTNYPELLELEKNMKGGGKIR